MVKFGQHINRLRDQDAEWGTYYLNYNDLKDIVDVKTDDDNDHDEERQEEDSNGWASTTKRASEEFSRRLYQEIERITLFVFEQQGKIAAELEACRHQLDQITEGEFFTCRYHTSSPADLEHSVVDQTTGQDHYFVAIHDGSSSNKEIDDIESKTTKIRKLYQQAGRSILKLYQFVDVNVTGIRKILKKHDKVLNSTPLTQQFLRPDNLMPRLSSFRASPGNYANSKQTITQWGNRMIQPLLNEDFLGALVVSMESGIMRLYQYELGRYQKTCTTSFKESLKSQSFNELGKLYQTPKIITGSRSSVSLTNALQLETESVDMILSQVKVAQRRLRQTSHFVQYLAAPMLVARQGSDEYGEDVGEVAPEMGYERSHISNWLNLLSTFFYMTNYYIVAPTSGDYARLVGGNSGLASLIIGMTSVAALVSTILYSWWTSYSYKHALVFASVCSTIGNLLYAAGLPYNSLTLVLLGRMLNGFGSARSINRRYIADTFSTEERTAASAMFVTASAMGMAAGPLLASLIHMSVIRLPNNDDNHVLRPENAPGWFMFFVWAGFSVCLIVYFRDPLPTWESALCVKVTPSEAKAEQSPLLTKPTSTIHSETGKNGKQLFLVQRTPVIVTLFCCFVLKLQVEAVLSSSANLPKIYFNWGPSVVGFYLACLGLMVLPANYIIGYLAGTCEDRDLIVGLLVMMVLGGLFMLDEIWGYTELQYILASTLLFVGSTALEGPNMSLLSKSIPLSWRKGVFNVGLLATEAGTFGRTVADALLTVFGANGTQDLLNRTFGSFTLVSLGALVICCQNFHTLRPDE